MANNYVHQQEMDEVLQDLKDYVKSVKGKYSMVPFEIIRSYKHDINVIIDNHSYDEDNESFFNLNALEEAAVLKNFGLWFQKEYKNMFDR